MPSSVVVFGASGKQGGSVVSSLLAANKKSTSGDLYAIRAVTRNPKSEKAQALVAQGVEVVGADLDDYPSILKAFEGVELAFGVTNFWDSFMNHQDVAQSSATEVRQGKHLADAAAVTPSLKHYIWSSLPCVDHSVPHLQSKVVIDDYIVAAHPGLAAKTTVLFLGYYASNLSDFDPPKKDNDGKGYVWRQPARKDAKIPIIGQTEVNTGVFAEAIFKRGDAAKGKYVQGMSDILSFEEFIGLWSKAAGVPAHVEQISFQEYVKTFHYGEAFGEELGLNMVYFAAWDKDMKGWTKPGGKLATKEELGIKSSDLVSAEETLKGIDWSSYKL